MHMVAQNIWWKPKSSSAGVTSIIALTNITISMKQEKNQVRANYHKYLHDIYGKTNFVQRPFGNMFMQDIENV